MIRSIVMATGLALMSLASKAQLSSASADSFAVVVAHRGAWKTADLPENSIASLTRAIRLGCTGSEFDVQMTLDDSLVVNHDPVYQGDTIERVRFKRLMRTPLKNGEPLPTLHQYLMAALQSAGHTRAVLEIKPSIISQEKAIKTARAVLKMVASLKAMDKIIFISFDYQVLKEINRLYPTAITEYLNGDKSPEQLKADGISGLDYHYSVFEKHPEWIEKAKALGLILNAWTVNDAATMDYLLAAGFDQVTTNEPELAASRAARHQRIYKDRKMTFSDEFNLPGSPSRALWRFETGSHGFGNHELQNYTDGDPRNVFIKDGLLHIVARKDDSQPKGYSAARMNQARGFLYGRLEVRAKLPPGRGLWPAIWLMPDSSTYGGWPKSGEIDLMENVGYDPDSVHFTIHTEKYNHVKGTQKARVLFDRTLYSSFHDYALEWSPDSLVFFMDDKQVFTYKNEHAGFTSWPYNKAFHLILNVAVGGDWGGKMGVDPEIFPATMLVDYVRVFQ